jgi:hypothetical protein
MANNQRMNIREMISLCNHYTGTEKKQVQIIAHEVREAYEYIDYYNLLEPHPRPRHRLRKLMGQWKPLY